ncbi:MAG: hypothetical protein MEQ84_12975 [Mesorhizobium sp.]|nr:hypothetical protein [Mesorhizobium sp.]
MSKEELRNYNAEAKRRQRARERQQRKYGETALTETNARVALADAAIVLLSSAGEGTDEVKRVLRLAFPNAPDFADEIERRILEGKLRPKLARPRLVVPRFLRDE